MTGELYRTLYCSRNWIAGEPALQDAEIGRILQVARANNSQQSVTGALLFNSGYFAQVLEGPRPAIERIFETIQRDRRHGDVVVLESGFAETRDFSDWSMAYVHAPTEGEAKHIGAALDQAVLSPATSAGTVLDLLRALVVPED